MAKTSTKVAVADPKKAEKKAAKKAAQKKLEDAVLAADAVDPSEALAPFLARPYAKNGLSVTVHPVTDAAKDLTPEDKKWIWNLLEKNMRPVYGPSAWKKEGKEKKAELDSEEARYLVAREHAPPAAENADPNPPSVSAEPGAPLGFVHYRFVVEEDAAVLYVYELQVDERARGKGLGKYLMMLAEALARKAGVGGVMLTVQRVNEGARRFYETNKYAVSPICPSKSDPWAFEEDEYDYQIMGKMWQQEALDALTKSGQKAWKENKEMFDAAQVFVHSNEELKEAFKKAAVA